MRGVGNLMPRKTPAVVLAAMLGVAAYAAGRGAGATAAAGSATQQPQPPTGAGSGMYSLSAAADGAAYLSWLEPVAGKAHAFKFAVLRDGRWSDAKEIARGDNWFVNWADHPSLVALPNGTLAAHWLVNNGTREGSYGYGFRIAISKDRGTSWQEVYAGGTDNTHGYSGFVSLLPAVDGLTAMYLGPPRERTSQTESDHTMTLGSVRISVDGSVTAEAVADANTCSCCSTSIAQSGRTPVAAYRDRAGDEIRDIAVVRLRDGRWTAPRTVHPDGWHINACPTNGPVLAADGSRVAVAWFTGAGNVGRVKVAFSDNGGETFGLPAMVDGGRPVGWPSTVLLDDGSAVVSWLETLGDGRGEVRLRRVWPTGRLGNPVVVAETASGRSTGIPQMVRAGDALVVAWRSDRVMTALVPIPDGGTLPRSR